MFKISFSIILYIILYLIHCVSFYLIKLGYLFQIIKGFIILYTKFWLLFLFTGKLRLYYFSSCIIILLYTHIKIISFYFYYCNFYLLEMLLFSQILDLFSVLIQFFYYICIYLKFVLVPNI